MGSWDALWLSSWLCWSLRVQVGIRCWIVFLDVHLLRGDDICWVVVLWRMWLCKLPQWVICLLAAGWRIKGDLPLAFSTLLSPRLDWCLEALGLYGPLRHLKVWQRDREVSPVVRLCLHIGQHFVDDPENLVSNRPNGDLAIL